jgi:hypothetical protein
MAQVDFLRFSLIPMMLTGTLVIWWMGRHVAGRLLVLIGTLHLSGAWMLRGPLARMAANGIVGQADSAVGRVPAMSDQELTFWFLLWGLFVILLGQCVITMEKRGALPPRWWGVELLVVSLISGVLIPKTGFWWITLPALAIIRRGER